MLSEHSGACWRDDGRMWHCWHQGDELSDVDCMLKRDRDGEIIGFQGACKYDDYGKIMTFDQVQNCSDIEECIAECHPITDKWGACYVRDKEGVPKRDRCLCVGNPGAEPNV